MEVNTLKIKHMGVRVMSKSRNNAEVWNDIFDDLVLVGEPPMRYIKDAVIVTKNGARFKVSADDFAEIVAKERLLDPGQSDIFSCSVTVDFARIKRDVTRWTNKLLTEIETQAAANIEMAEKRRRSERRRRKVD